MYFAKRLPLTYSLSQDRYTAIEEDVDRDLDIDNLK